MTFQHDRCPLCDEAGGRVTAQDSTTLVCENASCRVVTFSEYLG